MLFVGLAKQLRWLCQLFLGKIQKHYAAFSAHFPSFFKPKMDCMFETVSKTKHKMSYFFFFLRTTIPPLDARARDGCRWCSLLTLEVQRKSGKSVFKRGRKNLEDYQWQHSTRTNATEVLRRILMEELKNTSKGGGYSDLNYLKLDSEVRAQHDEVCTASIKKTDVF